MGWLSNLDAQIQQRIEAITEGGGFRSVGPLLAAGRSGLSEQIFRVDKPAFLYVIEESGGKAEDVAGRLQAVVVAEGLRGRDGAYRGDVDTAGVYDLSEAAAGALAQPALGETAGAWLVRQRLIYADERLVAFGQEYELLCEAPTVQIDGVEKFGQRSILRVVSEQWEANWQSVALPRSQQRWARWCGVGPRRIVLEGIVWCESETDLVAIEVELQNMLLKGDLHELTVGPRKYEDVTLVAFSERGGRIRQKMAGLVGQRVNVEFEQNLR